MDTSIDPSNRDYRFPREIIGYGVWLYFRFSVSDRAVEELMAERGVTATYGTIRAWCDKFSRDYATRIRARRGTLGKPPLRRMAKPRRLTRGCLTQTGVPGVASAQDAQRDSTVCSAQIKAAPIGFFCRIGCRPQKNGRPRAPVSALRLLRPVAGRIRSCETCQPPPGAGRRRHRQLPSGNRHPRSLRRRPKRLWSCHRSYTPRYAWRDGGARQS